MPSQLNGMGAPGPDDGPPLRYAPHNFEAEQALLGAILVDNEVYDRVSGYLEPRHFFDPLHQQIYEAAATLIAAGKHADPFTLKPFFDNVEPIDATRTVPTYLGALGAKVPTTINAREYGRTIRDLWIRRRVILIGEEMLTRAYDSPVDFPPITQIDQATGHLQSLGDIAGSERGNLLEYAADASVETRAEDLIRDAVPTAALVSFFGPSGGGKTFVAIEMAFSIAQGTPFFGRETTKAPVLYVAVEGKANLKKRIVAGRNRHGDPGGHLATMTRPVVFGRLPGADSSTAEIIRAIRQQTKAAAAPVGLVIVDTLARAMAGDNENDAAAMSTVAAQALRITAATGATVLFVHHPGKNAERGARGSYALFGAVDAEIVLEHETGDALRTLRVKKLRDGADGPVGAFALRRVVLGHDGHGREITTCTVEPAEGVAPTRVRLEPETAAGRALTELEHLGLNREGEPMRGHRRIPDGTITFSIADWRAACREKQLSSGLIASEERVFRGALKKLSGMGLIGRFGERVWLLNQETKGRTNGRRPPDGKPFADDSDVLGQADTSRSHLQ